jgi:hypothetical protein
MAFSVSTRSALDGAGATITGGVVFVDESGAGTGPWIIAKTTIDPAGVNVQFVLANNAAKCDISSINGTTTPTGHGTAAGALRVELPTDGTGLVNAAQSGAWNIGTVTTVTAVTAITNALPVGANVIGAVTQSGGPWSVSGTVTANQGGAPWTVNPGTAANWGVGATAAAVPANADYLGANAITSLPTAATPGNLVGVSADKFGRPVALISTIRDLVGTQTTTISASTAETTIVTAGAAGVFNDLIMLIVSNTSAGTTTRIDFRDTTAGTILFSLISVGGQQPVGFALAIPIPQTGAATNWTAQCAVSTTDIRIYAVFAKNK